jgi:hypothetical protein
VTLTTDDKTALISPLDQLINAAKEHGINSDTDHEVGDLQDLLRAAWNVMPQDVRQQFLRSDAALQVATEGDQAQIPYIHGQWNHLFGAGSQETLVRLVLDAQEKTIIAMQIKDGPLADRWVDVTQKSLILDVQDSVINANGDCLEDPEEYGLERAYVLPEWAEERDEPRSYAPRQRG